MANYITMAVRPSTGAVYDFFKRVNPDVIERYNYLANSLDDFLVQYNMNLVDLYKALAIRYLEFQLQNYVLIVINPSSGSHKSVKAVIRQSSGSHQAVIRQSSGSHQADIRQSSDYYNGGYVANIHCLYLSRCNEFVLICEVHRHTLNNPDQHCCDILFDTEPIFTGKGTCYRTNKTIYEYYPYSFSSIKIWTNLLQDQTPGTIRIIANSNSNSN